MAIIMVFLVHSRQSFYGLNQTFDIFKFGQMGCQIFFLLSGYSCCLSWKKSEGMKKFFGKRYIAIAPAYILMVIIMTGLSIWTKSYFGKTLGFAGNTNLIAILINLFLLNGLFPNGNNDVVGGGWYVGTTAILYLLFPLLFKWAKDGKNKFKIPSLLFVAQVIINYLLIFVTGDANVLENNGFVYFSFVNNIFCFDLGIILFFCAEEDILKSSKKSIYYDLIMSFFWLTVSLLLFFSNNVYIFFLVTDTVGISTYYFAKILLKEENRNVEKENDKVTNCLSTLGRKSYYIFLTHTFWVYSVAIVCNICVKKYCPNLNITLLYLVLLPLLFAGTLITARILEKTIRMEKYWIKAITRR